MHCCIIFELQLIAERVIIIANDSFSYNSQEIIEAWNAAQSTVSIM